MSTKLLLSFLRKSKAQSSFLTKLLYNAYLEAGHRGCSLESLPSSLGDRPHKHETTMKNKVPSDFRERKDQVGWKNAPDHRDKC